MYLVKVFVNFRLQLYTYLQWPLKTSILTYNDVLTSMPTTPFKRLGSLRNVFFFFAH